MEIASLPLSSCSREHQKMYQQWFSCADSDGDGRITGNDAIKFFSMLNLPRSQLKQIWAIADSKRQGFLGLGEFIVAIQLVALAQAGNEITQDVLTSAELENLEPPVMEGLDMLLAKTKPLVKKIDAEQDVPPLQVPMTAVMSIIDGLKRLYIEKLKPLEVTYCFNDFVYPLLSGPDERNIPGNTIAVQADMPYSGLTTFGTAFLSKFECSQMPHPLLEHITFVDTPGVLSGEKQRTQRSYDFTGVTSWFAAKCDLILLLFDPHKLDISDEFKRVIGSLRGHDDKICVVLNKADQVDTEQLMRVYGALMWSLGKVLNTPEVMRVYIGSFNDKPASEASGGPIGKELFKKEQDDLLSDLKDIPKKACDRRINEFVKHARAAKIHA